MNKTLSHKSFKSFKLNLELKTTGAERFALNQNSESQ